MSDNPKEIEHELERTRERLGENLNALTDRMSPGNLLDEAMNYFEGSPKDFANTLGTQVQRNPLATLMVGAGIAWLSMGKGEQPGAGLMKRDTYASDNWDDDDDDDDWDDAPRSGQRYPSGYDTTQGMSAASAGNTYSRFANEEDAQTLSTYDRIQAARSRVVREANETPSAYYARLDTAYGQEMGYTREAGEDDTTYRDRIRDGVETAKAKADEARRRVRDATRQAKRSARDMKRHAYDRASAVHSAGLDMKDQAYDRAHALHSTGRAKAGQLKHDAREFHEENPLVSGFIAMAAGALAGAVLPTSQQERDALEPLAREAEKHGVNLAGQAREHGERLADKARAQGERLADAAEQKAVEASHLAAEQAERVAAKAETYGDEARTKVSQAGKA